MSVNWFEDVDQRLLAGLEKGKREGYIFKGSTIVLLSGWRPGPANINTIRIFQVISRSHTSRIVFILYNGVCLVFPNKIMQLAVFFTGALTSKQHMFEFVTPIIANSGILII